MRRVKQLLPGLHTLEIALPDLSARAVVISGTERALVWDSLTCPADMAALDPLLGNLPFYLVYSHADWDHVQGSAGLARPPIFVIAHEASARRFEREAPQTLAAMQQQEPGRWDSVRLLPPNMRFRRHLSLDLGDVTVDLHHLPGHTPDGIVAWLPQSGTLLTGDATETPLPVINDASLLPGWLAALEDWAGNAALQRVIPTHGSADGRESLDKTIDYLRRIMSGDGIDSPADLDDFYRRTHQQNLKLTRQLADHA